MSASNDNVVSDKRNRFLTKLTEFDITIRGAYLATIIPIEDLVKDIISHHFCSTTDNHGINEDKRRQFISLILSGRNDYSFSFGIIDIFEKIMTFNYPDLIEQYPKLINDIRELIKFRNWLTHSILDKSDEFMVNNFVGNRIRLISYDDAGKIHYKDISRSEIDERLVDYMNVHFALEDILGEVKDRVFTSRYDGYKS